MKGYIFVLERNKEIVDKTSLDEDDLEYAKELYYKEFGYTKQAGDKIYLWKIDED